MSGYLNGLGGVFVFSRNPAVLADWYARAFDLEFERVGEQGCYCVFWSRSDQDPDRRLDTTFAVLPARGELPRPTPNPDPGDMYGDQAYMVNLRVEDMDRMLVHLDQQQVPVIRSQDEDYGRFVWVRDADGNRVELYQPLTAG